MFRPCCLVMFFFCYNLFIWLSAHRVANAKHQLVLTAASVCIQFSKPYTIYTKHNAKKYDSKESVLSHSPSNRICIYVYIYIGRHSFINLFLFPISIYALPIPCCRFGALSTMTRCLVRCGAVRCCVKILQRQNRDNGKGCQLNVVYCENK